tara:strand:- start:421 stop:567 length:147 start_codon:yes stop_codon:yes gene_type:complete
MGRVNGTLLLEQPVYALNLVVLSAQTLDLEPAEETLKRTLGWNVILQV